MKYPNAGELQRATVSHLTGNPARRNASGRYELHAEGGLEAIFADRDQAEFEADELRRRGVADVEVKVRPPAHQRARERAQPHGNPTTMSRDAAWLEFRRLIREPDVEAMKIAEDIVLEYRWPLDALSEQGRNHGIFVLSPAEVGAKLDQVEWEVEPVYTERSYTRGQPARPAGYGVGFKFVWHDNDEVLVWPSTTRYLRTQEEAARTAAADTWAMAKQMKQLQVDERRGATYSASEVAAYLRAVLDRKFKDTTAPAIYELRATKETGDSPKKKPTYAQAADDIWAALQRAGWSMSSPSLKTRHATSPNGYLRLWFKPQTIHATINSSEFAPGVRHAMGDARAIAYDLDIRAMSPSEFLDFIQSRFPKAFA